MADPIANAGADSTYSAGTLPSSIPLTAGAVSLGDGSAISSVQWTLQCKPAGSVTATIVNPTSVSASLDNVDVIGDYVITLVITNNVAQTSETNFRLMPDSAVRVISLQTAYAALSVPSEGQKGYAARVNAWATAIDYNRQVLDAIGAQTDGSIAPNSIQLDLVEPATDNFYVTVAGRGTHSVDLVADRIGTEHVENPAGSLQLLATGGLVNIVGNTVQVTATTTTFSDDVYVSDIIRADTIQSFTNNVNPSIRGRGTAVADLDVDVIQADTGNGGVTIIGKGTHSYDLQADVINTTSVIASASTLQVTASTATFSDDVYVTDVLRADTIQAFTDNVNTVIRGRGAAIADVDVDVIQADSGNSGVTIIGKGTHSYDLQADVILTTSVASSAALDVYAVTNLTVQADNSLLVTCSNGVRVANAESNFGTSGTYNSVPITLASAYPNTSTTGLVAETLWTTDIPANTLNSNGASITGELIFSTASATTGHNKTPTVKFNGTTVVTASSTVSGGWIKVTFTIMRTGSNTQIGFGNTFDSGSTHGSNGLVSITATDTSAITLLVQGYTPDGIGDMTLKTVVLHYNRAETAI